jgi:hypothetical protein
MPERPMPQPQRKPVREFQTPVPVDGYFTELIEFTDPGYAVPKRGTLYNTQLGGDETVAANFPNLYFLREIRFKEDHLRALWLWATDPASEDTYNAEISYMEEAIAYPAYTRVYTVRRDVFENTAPITPLLPLTALIAVNVTAGGTGYTAATGTIGSATVAFVCAAGAIIAGIVTAEGSSITSGGSITITGDGTGATATAIIQPASAVLTSQKKMEFPQDHPLHFEYVQVKREYETLPGPWVYEASLAEDSEVVTVKRRHNIYANITPGESASGGTLTKTTSKPISSLVSWEIVETRPLPGLVLIDYDQEPETQALITTTFQIVANPVSAPTATPGTLVKVKHIDDYNSWLITETRSTPSGFTYQENGAFHFPSLFDYTQYSWTDACGAFSTERAGFSCNVQMLIEVSFSSSVVEFTGLQLKPVTLELGKGVNISGVLVDSGSFTYTGSCVGTVTFPGSSPTYTGYASLIGSSQLIGGSSKLTKYGDWRTEKIYVTLA